MRVKLSALLALLAAAASAAGPEMDRARKLYSSTDFDGSLQLLHAMPAKDGAVYELIGRNYYMQGEFKKATEALEKAMAAEPGNSGYALWLGRAWLPGGRGSGISQVFVFAIVGLGSPN